MPLSLNTETQDDFLFTCKPPGLNTHRPSPEMLGFVEILERELKTPLFIAHRLDKETSGALVFGKSPEAARRLSDLFAQHQVQKIYYFITDKKISKNSFLQESYIVKQGGTFISKSSPSDPSEHSGKAVTQFDKIHEYLQFSLWTATPKTGKPHQIRLHAQDAGMPILGDSEHGGSPFTQLGLHAHQIKFQIDGKNYHYQAPLPFWTELEKLSLATPLEAALNLAVERRKFLFQNKAGSKECLRLVHHEAHPDQTCLRMDQFGPVLWTYWYKPEDPSEKDFSLLEQLQKKLNRPIWIRKMNNRGRDPNSNTLWPLGNPPNAWTATENEINYHFSTDLGLSPGLFLDLRSNRQWVQENVTQKKVLNLFAYTGGFSLAAAKGKASEVVTLDLSKTFLEWSQRNFQLNQLDPKNYEFWNQDVFIFLKGCKKRNRKFDLIICDPPSFSRSKNSIFSIEKDLENLLNLCWDNLEPQGKILFSSNFEKWDKDFFRKKITQYLPHAKDFSSELPYPGLDVGFPGEPSLTKSFLLQK